MEHRQLAPAAALAPDICAPSYNLLHANEPEHQARFNSEDTSAHDDRLETPVDPLTGLPACLVPPSRLPQPPGVKDVNLSLEGDWNHQFPKSEVRANRTIPFGGIGKLALINLRKQWVDFSQHHDIYNYEYRGPEQPKTVQDLFRTAVFGLAGAVPEIALDLSKKESKREVLLREDERRMLWDSGQVRLIDRNSVSNLLLAYIIAQDVQHIRIDEIHELLKTQDNQRKLYLAHALSAKVVEAAVEPLTSDYLASRSKGLLHPSAPNNARDLVKPNLVAGKRTGRVINAMIKKLADHYHVVEGAPQAA